jgi:ferredoxin
MKVMVNGFACDGHMMCIAVAPDAFKSGTDGKAFAQFIDVPADQHDAVRAAAVRCPQRAVMVLESES